MANNAGEMPFLDHLEELRKRILLSLVAIMVGFGVGWWVTTHFNLIQLVEAPIAPLIPGGKLSVMSATDPFMIVLKFAFLLGLVLASPFVIYQLWLFLAPALTTREKRAIVPSLGIGFLLFAGGAALGWFFVVTPAVAWLLGFQSGTFNPIITYESYMRLVIHLLVGMGISAELPLVMILLASLGIMTHRGYSRFRRYAVLGAFVGGAILAPTPEVSMMIIFTIPLLLLYEVGVAGAYIVEKRRARSAARLAAGVLLFVLCLAPHAAHAQIPPPIKKPVAAPVAGGDTTRRGAVTGQGVQRYDTSMAKRLGLPSGPTAQFGSDDPILKALLAREGFASTQYSSDSVRYDVSTGAVELSGHAATLRDGDQLEAHGITYDNAHCQIRARGDPRMFQKGQSPAIAQTLDVDICQGQERGVLGEGFTSLPNGGANWFIRGNIAADSGGKRMYIGGAQFTSCDLPDPHYHFKAGEVKWVSNSVIVARPAVLYIRDVPIAWLPFIFQDTRRNRASGILIPRFGFNDIVRTNRNYNRTISNVGYYWAPNDYIDVTGSVDWYANRYTQYTGRLNYHWLDRFMVGSLTLSRQMESDRTSNILHWDHRQDFNVTTSLTFNLNYQSDSRVQLQNAIDPLASTALITSALNLSKKYRWGTVSFGGNRSEALGTGTGTMTLPQLSIQPKAIAFGQHVTWSPNLSVTSLTGFNNPLPPVNVLLGTGSDTLTGGFSHQRQTSVDIDTPLQIFGFTWQNHVKYNDQQFVGRVVSTRKIPNPLTNGLDSVQVVSGGNYQTGLNWDTGVNLPTIAPSTWKLVPSIGVTNIATGDLLVRSAASDGTWVSQGKKVQLGLSAAPTFFGFLNRSVGPFSLFRYTFEPLIQLQWSPAASVSEAYANAARLVGNPSVDGGTPGAVPATSAITVSLHQTFEGKFKRAAGDTNTDPTHLTKKQIISISTSPFTYDPQQAKLPHRTGWTTGTLTNSFSSQLIPAITLSTTHSLWDGDVGSDTAKFSPFLTSANASVQLTGSTIHAIGRFLHLSRKDTSRTANTAAAPAGTAPVVVGSGYSALGLGGGLQQRPIARGFSAQFNYTLTRYRPNGTTALPVSTEPTTIGGESSFFPTNSIIPIVAQPASNQLGVVMSFAPTPFWSVSWNTQYDITHGVFESQNIVLQRDLHDWRASFTFTKNTNGNFALYFTVFLINLPDIKFDYNQTTLQQVPIQP
jgi:Tat protein translocase TatC